MTAQHQRLDGQEQRLDPQQQRMHQSDAIDDMQDDFPARAGLLRNDFLVIARNSSFTFKGKPSM